MTKRVEKIAELIFYAQNVDPVWVISSMGTERFVHGDLLRELARAGLARNSKPAKRKPISKLSPRGRAVKEQKRKKERF